MLSQTVTPSENVSFVDKFRINEQWLALIICFDRLQVMKIRINWAKKEACYSWKSWGTSEIYTSPIYCSSDASVASLPKERSFSFGTGKAQLKKLNFTCLLAVIIVNVFTFVGTVLWSRGRAKEIYSNNNSFFRPNYSFETQLNYLPKEWTQTMDLGIVDCWWRLLVHVFVLALLMLQVNSSLDSEPNPPRVRPRASPEVWPTATLQTLVLAKKKNPSHRWNKLEWTPSL